MCIWVRPSQHVCSQQQILHVCLFFAPFYGFLNDVLFTVMMPLVLDARLRSSPKSLQFYPTIHNYLEVLLMQANTILSISAPPVQQTHLLPFIWLVPWLLMYRVEHGYTAGRVFPHHTRTCVHRYPLRVAPVPYRNSCGV